MCISEREDTDGKSKGGKTATFAVDQVHFSYARAYPPQPVTHACDIYNRIASTEVEVGKW